MHDSFSLLKRIKAIKIDCFCSFKSLIHTLDLQINGLPSSVLIEWDSPMLTSPLLLYRVPRWGPERDRNVYSLGIRWLSLGRVITDRIIRFPRECPTKLEQTTLQSEYIWWFFLLYTLFLKYIMFAKVKIRFCIIYLTRVGVNPYNSIKLLISLASRSVIKSKSAKVSYKYKKIQMYCMDTLVHKASIWMATTCTHLVTLRHQEFYSMTWQCHFYVRPY